MPCLSFLSRKKAASPPKHAIDIDEEVSSVKNITMYSYRDLQIATERFNPANKVGQGGFGAVFKGKLKDGTMVAIKVLSSNSKQGVREFLTEINVITDIEHENLVKLYGCCIEGSHRILVYGYLENNSLAQTLLGRRHSSIQFDWSTQRNICIGVANGLAFLHEEIRPHIIHRDIKASNILLDKNFIPKISDFGLAKLFPANLTHVSTRIAGTEGYLAPEYAIRGQLTRKADIYSFGVLLLEIVCARSNTNKKLPPQEQYLLQWAWELHKKKNLVELLDTSLYHEDFSINEACRYIEIALLCTQDRPKLRPSMSTVVKMLKGEIIFDVENMSAPGLLSEIMGQKIVKDIESSGSEKLNEPDNVSTSYATMTFSSIYDRDN